MYKRILVAVDGSQTAELALQESAKLAKALHAQLRIAHVVDVVTLNWPEYGDYEEVMKILRESGRAILEKADADLRKAGVTPETKLLEIDTFGQRVSDAMAAEAESWPADLIVIGTHGRRGVNRLLLGSVAESLARVTTKPVLLVRGQ